MIQQRSVLVLIVMMTLSVCRLSAQLDGKLSPYETLYGEWKAEAKALENFVPPLTTEEKRTKTHEIDKEFTVRFRDLAKEHRNDDEWIH